MSDSLAVTIPNIGTVPLSAFESLVRIVPVIANGVRTSKAPADIEAEIVATLPGEALSVAEALLSVFFPGAGTILGLIAWVIENQKPMTLQEQIDWMNETTSRNDDSRSGSG